MATKPRGKTRTITIPNSMKLTHKQKKPGHFEGQYWIWGDGKRTSVKFIKMAMITKRKLPPGFYAACKSNPDPDVKRMGTIAKDRKLEELK